MADVYLDMSLVTGTANGTSWANAYQTFFLMAAGVSSGDDVWCRGTSTSIATESPQFPLTDGNLPVKLYGVKVATVNAPPEQSDLVPGWRTGEVRTNANRATEDTIPIYAVDDTTGSDVTIRGHFYAYAFHFKAADNISLGTGETHVQVFEECVFEPGSGSTGFLIPGINNTGDQSDVVFKNCRMKLSSGGVIRPARTLNLVMIGVKWDVGVALTGGMFASSAGTGGNMTMIGCDFSDEAHTIMSLSNVHADRYKFLNCQLHASSALGTGALDAGAEVEFHHTVNVTGKSSGSIQNIDILTGNGNITNETSIVRTNGADDGGTGAWSLAFTPTVDNTLETFRGLKGLWMAFEIIGDGTNKTVTVFIANSGSLDYDDDDVWLEIIYPSEGGTAQYENLSTEMDLLGTPTVVTDDVGSTWGTGGDNHQKLQLTIAPDYEGIAYCRVVFAKAFASDPETLYVDPLPVLS